MSTTWKNLPPEEAARHPLYGVKNWLAVFAFGILLGLLRELGSLSGEAHKAGMTVTQLLSVDHPAISFAKLALGLNFILVALIYWALLTKHPKFRLIASSALLLSWPLVAVLGLMFTFDGLGEALAFSLFSWAFSCAVWVTYLQRSKRVRVTFEHCIKADSSQHAQPSGVVTKPSAEVRAGLIERNDSQEPTTRTPESLTVKQFEAKAPFMNSSANDADETLWELALSEFEGDARRSGLYAKAFSESNGDEALTKAAYLRHRVDQLAAERGERERAAAGARADTDRAAKAQIEDLKIKFISGRRLNEDEIKTLVQYSHLDQTLPALWERHCGETLLHWCARFRLKHEIEILLKNGANPKASNANGQMPSAVTDDFEIRRVLFSAARASEA